MDKNDMSILIRWDDVPAAVGLLTRLPVKVDGDKASARGAASAWAYPVAGMVVALIAGFVGQMALFVGLPPMIAAVLVLAALILPTGALHEDGLADSADGLWGGWTRERRLEIMKDSRIGAYGVIALILSLMLRGAALTILVTAGHMWAALLVGAAFGRAGMVVLMHLLPNARTNGLSQSVGRPSAPTTGVAVGIAGLTALVLVPGQFIALGVLAAIALAGCAMLAKVKIGGQTGDILGASGQILEITVLLVLVAS